MLWLAVGHSVSAVPLQCPFCHHHPFLFQVSQPPPLFLLPTIRLLRRAGSATSPSEDSQALVPAGFAPVLLSLPKAPVPSGSAPVAQCSLLRVPFPWPLCLAGVPLCPAVSPVAVSFHGHVSGHRPPAPCARPLTTFSLREAMIKVCAMKSKRRSCAGP